MASTLDKAKAYFVKQGKWDFYERFDGWQKCEFAHAYALSCEAETRREIADELIQALTEQSDDEFAEWLNDYIEKLRGRK